MFKILWTQLEFNFLFNCSESSLKFYRCSNLPKDVGAVILYFLGNKSWPFGFSGNFSSRLTKLEFLNYKIRVSGLSYYVNLLCEFCFSLKALNYQAHGDLMC